MNDLQIFSYESKQIRTVLINEEPWWVAKDVCDYFGDTDHKRSVSRLDDTDKQILPVIDSLNRNQSATCVNESGLYSLLFNFQPEKATKDGGAHIEPRVLERLEKIKKFKKWITSEVLPSIRKTGQYSIKIPQSFAEALRLAADQAEQIELMKPKADEYDLFINNKGYQKIGDVAKTLNIKPNTLHRMLRDAKILQPNYAPYAGYEQYFHTVNNPTKGGFNVFTSYLKPTGISYIVKRFNLTMPLLAEVQ